MSKGFLKRGRGLPPREALWHRHPADYSWAGRGPPTRHSALGTPSPCHDEAAFQTPSHGRVALLEPTIGELLGEWVQTAPPKGWPMRRRVDQSWSIEKIREIRS